jgi:hypothetical protein
VPQQQVPGRGLIRLRVHQLGPPAAADSEPVEEAVALDELSTAGTLAAHHGARPVDPDDRGGGVPVSQPPMRSPWTLTPRGKKPGAAADNTGGTEIAGNRVGGPLTCTGNAPAPVDAGRVNTVTGPRKGQCSAVGF